MANRDNNKMGSWIKVLMLSVGAAGAIYGAFRYLLGQQQERQQHSNQQRRRSSPPRRRSNVVERECRICSESSDEFVTFLPCMHTLVCLDCGARMRKCFECRSVILDRVSEESGKTVPYKPPGAADDQLCPICLDNKKRIIINCGHTLCRPCSERVEECPVCRERIISRNPFF